MMIPGPIVFTRALRWPHRSSQRGRPTPLRVPPVSRLFSCSTACAGAGTRNRSVPSSCVITESSVGATVSGESQSFWALGCACSTVAEVMFMARSAIRSCTSTGFSASRLTRETDAVAGLFVEGGGDVDDGHVAAARRLHVGSSYGNPEGIAGGGVAQHSERPVDALYEKAVAAGQDRRDDVDDLREAGDLDDVGVAKERMEVLRAHEGVLEVVGLLEQVGRLLEVHHGYRISRYQTFHSSNETWTRWKLRLTARTWSSSPRYWVMIASSSTPWERNGRGVVIVVAAVVVGGDVVDVVPALLDNDAVPLGVCRKPVGAAAAGDRLDGRVKALHEGPSGAGSLGIGRRRRRARLARAHPSRCPGTTSSRDRARGGRWRRVHRRCSCRSASCSTRGAPPPPWRRRFPG